MFCGWKIHQELIPSSTHVPAHHRIALLAHIQGLRTKVVVHPTAAGASLGSQHLIHHHDLAGQFLPLVDETLVCGAWSGDDL